MEFGLGKRLVDTEVVEFVVGPGSRDGVLTMGSVFDFVVEDT